MNDLQIKHKPSESPLLRFPCELVVHTASYLSADDLFSLRLTCRCVESFLFETFSVEFFSDRRFMVNEYSLQCLLNISKHPYLSKRLSNLTIGLDRLYSSEALSRPEDRVVNTDNPRVKEGIEPYKLEELAAEQNWLVSSGRLQLLLGEALDNLANVVELSLRDTNAGRRHCRPGLREQLVSYGSAEVHRRTGVDLLSNGLHLHSQDQFADMVFSATLLAVARSGKRPETINVIIQRNDMGLSSSAFMFPRSLLSTLRPALENLRSLNLSVSFTYIPLGSFAQGSRGFLPWQPHYLFSLLEETPNLVRLRVVSKGQSFLPGGEIQRLAWLIDSSSGKQAEKPAGTHIYGDLPPSLGRINLSQGFKALKDLELKNMIAPSNSLTKIILHLSASLRKLCLCVIGVKVSPEDDELDNDPGCPNAWSSIFREMSTYSSLENLQVGFLGHQTENCTRNENIHQVVFLRSEIGTQSASHSGLFETWSYSGSTTSMKSFLLELADKTIIICTRCRQRNQRYRSPEEVFGR
ncbi:uncharacterized protein F4812DRAFT_412341 [Daldinia caldariorum]|uniref:uncharacterized protein n=1 Tax=Daldinia caldariorum TaxID=326644 RepID=UPI002008A4C1|nr:uncharacterized protein F4812DRAFT_412341 [Daldinia caldariorum]KAI1471003.1 hypothetical protein F4812DRAFT_412341 [Daldinia caldariorum]